MMTVVWGGMRAVTSTIKEGIQSAIAAPETENLFRVALWEHGKRRGAIRRAVKKK